jgi:IS30 family transposase
MEGFAFVLRRIEAQKRLSMTYDQGKEMSDHHDIDPSRLYHFNAEKLASLAHDFVAHALAEYDLHGEG